MFRQLTIIGCLMGLIVLAGCDNQQQAQAKTDYDAQHPTHVTTLPDGRELYMIVIHWPGGAYDHYVYYFGTNDTKTVSVNYQVSQGKTTRTQTIVINGETYSLVPTNN